MYCKNCGTELIEGNAFCVKCGNKNLVENKKSTKTVLAWLFAVLSFLLAGALLIVLFVPGIIPDGVESKGFETPEAAIEYFINCINEGDVQYALAVSCAEQVAEKADYEVLCDRIQAVQFNTIMPTEYEFYRVYNETKYKSELLTQIRGMVLSLTQPEYASVYTEGVPLILQDEKADYKGANPTLEQDIEILDIDTPVPDLYYADANQSNMEKQQRTLGADSLEWKVVLYKYDGDYFVGGFQLIEYDEKYYILSAYEILIGQSPIGGLISIDDRSDFDDYIE